MNIRTSIKYGPAATRLPGSHGSRSKRGSMIWLTGSQKLVDVRQKDGATVKKLKVWLTDFGFLPGQSSRAKAEHEQHDSDAAATAPAPSEVMDGDRESLPE